MEMKKYEQNPFFELIKLKKNLGVAYNYNQTLKKCIEDSFDLITLFSDDVIIEENNFEPEDIIKFFNNKCLPDKDILSLLYNPKSRTVNMVVDTGITASSIPFKKMTFR